MDSPLKNFLFEIGIYFWAVENLGSSHHVSVVHGMGHTRRARPMLPEICPKFFDSILYTYNLPIKFRSSKKADKFDKTI